MSETAYEADDQQSWNRYEHELQFLYILRWIMGITALIAFLLLAIDYGVYLDATSCFWIETGQIIVGYLFLCGYALQLITRRDRWKYLHYNKFKYAASLGMLFEIAIVSGFQIDLRTMWLLQDLGPPHLPASTTVAISSLHFFQCHSLGYQTGVNLWLSITPLRRILS